MKQVDRYYFFLFNAISEANKNPKYSYFLNLKDEALIMKRTNYLSEKIDDNLKELPKLTYKEKKDFLKSFLAKQKETFHAEINRIIDNYKEDWIHWTKLTP